MTPLANPGLYVLAPWEVWRGVGAPKGRQGLFRSGSALLPRFPCLPKAEIMPPTDLFQLF